MSYVARSRVLRGTEILAVLPTWSDGAVVRFERPDLTVQDGEWIGRDCDYAPEITDRGASDFLARLAEDGGA